MEPEEIDQIDILNSRIKAMKQAAEGLVPAADYLLVDGNRDHGSAYDYWLRMGAPDGGKCPSLDQYRLELLKASAHPLVHSIQPRISQGVLEYDAVLEPLEFRLIQINFCDN